MKNNISFKNKEIFFLYKKLNKKYNVELIYSFVNEYQLYNKSIKTPKYIKNYKMLQKYNTS